MSPDNVASSITLGNFTVGRPYRRSDMPDSSPMPIFAADRNKSGRQVSHIKRFISRQRYRLTKSPNMRPA